MTLNSDAAANRIALITQLYDVWGGYYLMQRIDGGAYVDVKRLTRDEAMTYRMRQDEALKLEWNQEQST